MLITDYNNLIKNIKYRKDRYLKDFKIKNKGLLTDVSLFECFAFGIWPSGLSFYNATHENGNKPEMYNVLGTYEVKDGGSVVNDHIVGKTLTYNAIIGKIEKDYKLSDVCVVNNDKQGKAKLTFKNIGQNVSDVHSPKEEDIFDRAKLLCKVLENNDLDTYGDIIIHNIKNLISSVIAKDISKIYEKTLDKNIIYSKTYPSIVYGEDGTSINITKAQLADAVTTNKPAKKLLYKTAKKLEKDNYTLELNAYIDKYESMHKAFVAKNEELEQEEQEQNQMILER